MSEDKLKNQQNKNLSDNIVDYSITAIAAGAMAAFGYRKGGARALSLGLEKVSHMSKVISQELATHTKDDWGSAEFARVKKKIKDEWKNSSSSINDTPITLRTNTGSSNFFSYLNEIGNFNDNIREHIKKAYTSEKLLKPTLDFYHSKYKNLGTVSDQRLQNYIHGLTKIPFYKDFKQNASYAELLKRSNLKDSEIKIADELADFMYESRQKNSRSKFVEDHISVFNNIVNESLRVENIEKYFGSASKQSNSEKFFEKVLNDSAVTIEDLLKNKDKIRDQKIFSLTKNGKIKATDTIEQIEQISETILKVHGKDAYERFLQITPDAKYLRKNKQGDFYSFKEVGKIVESTLDFAAGTLPGKILKLRDYQYSKNSPLFYYTGQGSLDPILAALNKSKTFETNAHHFRILGKEYILQDKKLKRAKHLDNTYLIPGEVGGTKTLLKKMLGHSAYSQKENEYMRVFDVAQSGDQTFFGKWFSKLVKFKDPNWDRNRYSRAFNMSETEFFEYEFAKLHKNKEHGIKRITDAEEIEHLYNKNTYELSDIALQKLSEKLNPEAQKILSLLKEKDNEKFIENLLSTQIDDSNKVYFINEQLNNLINRYVKKTWQTKEEIHLKTDRSLFFGVDDNEAFSITQLFRQEVAKEGMLVHAKNKNKLNYDEVYDIINNLDLSGSEKSNLKYLNSLNILQDYAGVSRTLGFKKDGLDVEDIWDQAKRIDDLFYASEENYAKTFREITKQIIEERTDVLASIKQYGDNYAHEMIYPSRIHMQKTVTPLDLLKNINNKEKSRAIGKKMLNQFFAGRDNPEDITTLTMFPYFLLSRLSDGANELGLGFSRDSSKSAWDLSKNAMLKRIIPAIVAYNYLDWTDDTVQEITGTGIFAAGANTLANADLAFRGFTDTIGLTGLLKSEKNINPVLQYWFGKEPYQSYEERKKYYEKGYDPVRKGRYWIFASANEFRGGGISYWEPNFARRANSDYYDKSMYDGYWDKWSHSLLPTPTNPISPIIGLLDPYWLERKHSEDRPYPVSGSMFTEGTPWGMVLNATVGDVIKPKKFLHKDRLQDGVDIRALIYSMNKDVYNKANENKGYNLVEIKNGKLSSVKYTSFAAPTMDERVISLNNRSNFNNIEDLTFNDLPDSGIPDLSELDNYQYTPQYISKMPESVPISQSYGIQEIQKLNNEIIRRSSGLEQYGTFTANSIGSFKKSKGMELLEDAETVQQLINESTGSSFVKEAALSARLISGIYGYAANRTFGLGNNLNREIATSEDMTSPFRTFWDSGFAGFSLFGVGETLEITRRFLPDYKRNAQINPLMNTMPDWMPERFRFGDAFTALPKGEMRLPGKGYESLNPLHPDMFGEYGAFDRFKILADIAPYSVEYKIWRDITKKTIKNPELLEEIEEIKWRVSEQGKTHDFYNYRFLNQKVDYVNATISEVLKDGKFKLVGSNEIYKIAGIKINKNLGFNPVEEILHSGQAVVVAKNQHSEIGAGVTGAAVFANGLSVGQTLIEEGFAKSNDEDYSGASSLSKYTAFENLRGSIYETVTHIDVPLLSDRFLRVRSPLESYRAEQVYGTPYQTWSDITGSYIYPALERMVSSETSVAIGQGAEFLHNKISNIEGLSPMKRKMATVAYGLANRGAFIGGTLAFVLKPNSGSFIKAGASLGSFSMLAGQLWVGRTDPFESAIGFGKVGYEVSRIAKKNKITGTALGAAAGLGFFGQNYNIFDSREEWIPNRTLQKWKYQEYFDRLTYIKYMGLYNKAVDKAIDEEGINIDAIINEQRDNEKKKITTKDYLARVSSFLDKYLPEGTIQQSAKQAIKERLSELEEQKEAYFKIGSWAQSALIYREAAESTYYGLQEDASWSQAIRSLPKNDRDYFMAFSGETDPDEREKILQVASPMLKRLLKKQWGMEVEDLESNESYFQRHNLPIFNWAGWKPDVDLEDVKVKTIYNEGMLLSDFGYYESQLRDLDVINAPNLDIRGSQDPLTVRANLMATLNSFGLTGVEVNVQPSKRGIDVLYNVATITKYNVTSAIQNVFSLM